MTAMRSLLLVLAALTCACATLKNDKTVCPESRDLRCATRVTCAMDHARGCQVCQCESAAPQGPDGKPGLPPPPGSD
jgi:hypothetical protein